MRRIGKNRMIITLAAIGGWVLVSLVFSGILVLKATEAASVGAGITAVLAGTALVWNTISNLVSTKDDE